MGKGFNGDRPAGNGGNGSQGQILIYVR
jgi:hypothetical protein